MRVSEAESDRDYAYMCSPTSFGAKVLNSTHDLRQLIDDWARGVGVVDCVDMDGGHDEAHDEGMARSLAELQVGGDCCRRLQGVTDSLSRREVVLIKLIRRQV